MQASGDTVKSTNEDLIDLVHFLRRSAVKNKSRVWRAAADQLERSKTRRREVNISRLARFTSSGDTVLVPGKVLGSGTISHPVKVAAFNFSSLAAKAVTEAGGECLSIRELVESNPSGAGIRLLG